MERIEESFLSQMFKTTKGCPLSQLYLEAGHAPARFEVKKIRLLFLQNILQENPGSQIYKFLELQFQNPTKGDWASSCAQDLEDLEIQLSVEEIKSLTKKTQFCQIIKKAIQVKAL